MLPNGMLVIEAARQIEFSQQTQTIVLRGLVRPEDISQQNQVLSTAISSLELAGARQRHYRRLHAPAERAGPICYQQVLIL